MGLLKLVNWSSTSVSEFFSDLKSVLGLSALKRVGRKVFDDDCLGLAGQLRIRW